MDPREVHTYCCDANYNEPEPPKKNVYVVDVYDCGVERAFSTYESAIKYIQDLYIDNLDKTFDWSIQRGLTAEELVKQIKADLVQLRDESYIEEYAYIYTVQLD